MTTTATATATRPSSAPIARSPLSSGSVRVHVARGLIGLAAAVAAIALVSLLGPAALALLVVTVIAWRGCPTCWAVGLMGTVADERRRRSCSSCRP